jgi:crotonobetainyl-CoA:carnitine CoA-transferase CaiB-like acyl-CoA transferase
VIDFSWVLTGPICTRYLASLDADIIKVESATRADLSTRDLAWQELNHGKRSVTAAASTRPRTTTASTRPRTTSCTREEDA